jgi:hypothetical protein
MTTATDHVTVSPIADPQVVGRLNFRGDIRHTNPSVVGPTDDGRWLAPIYAEYSPERDTTTIAYRTADARDLTDEDYARHMDDIARRRRRVA